MQSLRKPTQLSRDVRIPPINGATAIAKNSLALTSPRNAARRRKGVEEAKILQYQISMGRKFSVLFHLEYRYIMHPWLTPENPMPEIVRPIINTADEDAKPDIRARPQIVPC